jgi:hypothetical protein
VQLAGLLGQLNRSKGWAWQLIGSDRPGRGRTGRLQGEGSDERKPHLGQSVCVDIITRKLVPARGDCTDTCTSMGTLDLREASDSPSAGRGHPGLLSRPGVLVALLSGLRALGSWAKFPLPPGSRLAAGGCRIVPVVRRHCARRRSFLTRSHARRNRRPDLARNKPVFESVPGDNFGQDQQQGEL